MPSVRPHETESDYMARCVPDLIREGKDKDQAVAQCLSMFKHKWKAKAIEVDIPQKIVKDKDI